MKRCHVFAIAAGIGLCAWGEVTFSGPSDAMGNSSFTNAAVWSDGNLPTNSTIDYRVVLGQLRSPTYGDYVFKGKSLTVGRKTDLSKRPALAACTWDSSAVRSIEFQNDGLILECGCFNQNNDQGTKIIGKITVAAPPEADFFSSINQPSKQAGMDGAGVVPSRWTPRQMRCVQAAKSPRKRSRGGRLRMRLGIRLPSWWRRSKARCGFMTLICRPR